MSAPANWPRRLRLASAVIVGGGLTVALLDFRSLIPAAVGHHLASLQFVPALRHGGTALLIVAALVLLTFAVGRVYCSALCPLGILQDVIIRLAAALRRKPQLLRFTPAWTRLRYTFLAATVLAILIGWGGTAFALMDPYSQFGRIVSTVLRPLLVLVNNALTGPVNAAGFQGLYRVDAVWAATGALALPALLLVGLTYTAAFHGRLYCNTLCPVGTLLGLFARRARWRLVIDGDACGKCAACLRSCKAQCIDLRTGEVDFSRCVGCFNCLASCERSAIRLNSERRAAPAPAPEPEPTPAAFVAAGRDRRTFLAESLTGLATLLPLTALARRGEGRGHREDDDDDDDDCDGSVAGVVVPPGAKSLERFLEHCTACQLCVSACPTGVLQPSFLEFGFAGWMKPRLDFKRSFCNFDCTRCLEVCPTGALVALDLPTKQVTRLGKAVFHKRRCIVHDKGTDCAACSEHCPTKAVDTVPYRNGLFLPKVNDDLCIGCGACEYACPVKDKAIEVTPLSVHEIAEKKHEAKATRPTPAGDFPF